MARDVDDAVIDQGLRFFAGIVVHAVGPGRHKAFHGVPVDLCERTVTLVVVAHPVGEHVLRRFFGVLDLVSRLRKRPKGKRHG